MFRDQQEKEVEEEEEEETARLRLAGPLRPRPSRNMGFRPDWY